MKICDVVKNSVWYDPRVRKQILSYQNTLNCEVKVVGMEDLRYEEQKIANYPCEIQLVHVDKKFFDKKRTFITKIKRELFVNKKMKQFIVDYNPDIIHANDMNALIPAYKAAKKLNCKVIYDSHEIFVENAGIVNHRIVKFVYTVYERYLVKHIDKMICVSHAAAEYFAQKYKIDKPMVITNCSLKSEQCFLEEKNDGFEVLNHGQFYHGRGYDIMLDSLPYLSSYPEIKLALRGFGVLEKELRIRAKEFGEEQVRFYPKVLVQELIPMAARSYVGVAITEPVCLNFKLSISNKLFEYTSAGVPVIMSDIPEHRYLNEKYQFGIVMSDNHPKTFADAVIKMYTDKQFYDKCKGNAIKLSKEINWENEFQRLIDYERCLLER